VNTVFSLLLIGIVFLNITTIEEFFVSDLLDLLNEKERKKNKEN